MLPMYVFYEKKITLIIIVINFDLIEIIIIITMNLVVIIVIINFNFKLNFIMVSNFSFLAQKSNFYIFSNF